MRVLLSQLGAVGVITARLLVGHIPLGVGGQAGLGVGRSVRVYFLKLVVVAQGVTPGLGVRVAAPQRQVLVVVVVVAVLT